jgi:hypothetical protein
VDQETHEVRAAHTRLPRLFTLPRDKEVLALQIGRDRQPPVLGRRHSLLEPGNERMKTALHDARLHPVNREWSVE